LWGVSCEKKVGKGWKRILLGVTQKGEENMNQGTHPMARARPQAGTTWDQGMGGIKEKTGFRKNERRRLKVQSQGEKEGGLRIESWRD